MTDLDKLAGTSFSSGKGDMPDFEVENLIKETLKETKKDSPPQPNAKENLIGTAFSIEKPKTAEKSAEINPSSHKPIPPTSANIPAKTAEPTPKTKEKIYEDSFRSYKTGDLVTGIVVKVDQQSILVDIGYKAEGLITAEEFNERGTIDETAPKIGEKISAYITKLENKEGYVVLSKKKADYELKWKTAYDAFKSRKTLEAKVISAVKGGLVAECLGIKGFIPASQVNKSPEESLESFVGKTLAIKVIQIDRRQGKIVLSHKIGDKDKKHFNSEKTLQDLEVGQVKNGTVSSLKNFGAFVDIGGVEGLVHISELSWKRVKHPSEVLKVGDNINVFILGVDKENKKIALGLKELQEDPWVQAAEKYKPGDIIKVKILRFTKFGIFVEINENLEGLVHISEISSKMIKTAEETGLKTGDIIDAKVLRVLPEEQRIGLSIKQVLLDKEKEDLKEFQPTAENKITIADALKEKEKMRTEVKERPKEKEEENHIIDLSNENKAE